MTPRPPAILGPPAATGARSAAVPAARRAPVRAAPPLSAPMRAATLLPALLAAALASALVAPAARAAAGPEEDLAKRLQEALAAKDLPTAQARLREAERLLAAVGARGDPLRRAFFAADIKRTEGRVGVAAWRRDPKQVQALTDARRALREARDAYETLVEQYDDRAEKVRATLPPEADPARHPAYADASQARLQAKYLLAWTEYALGTSFDTRAEREAPLRAAAEHFKYFTDLGYRDHTIITDCFFGHAMALHELREDAAAAEMLKVLTPENTKRSPPDLYRRALVLRFLAHQGAGNLRDAEASAREYFDRLGEGARLDAGDLRLALDWARCLESLAAAPDASVEVKQVAKARLEKVARVVAAYGDPWRNELARFLGAGAASTPWLCLANARRHFEAQAYAEALAEAVKGLQAVARDTEPAVVADLRYARFAACWRMSQWREAHLAGFEFLQFHAADPRARDVCRQTYRAAASARAAGAGLPEADFQRFVAYAERQFPDVPEVRQGPWLEGNQLLQQKKFAEAEAVLQKVPPTAPSYRLAQYGLGLAAYRQAEQAAAAPGDPAAPLPHLRRAADAARRFIQAARTVADDDRPIAKGVLDTALAAAQRLASAPDPGPETARTLLLDVDRWPWAANQETARRQALASALAVRAARPEEIGRTVEALLAQAAAPGAGPPAAQLLSTLCAAARPLEEQHDRARAAGDSAAAGLAAARLVDLYTFLLAQARRGQDASLSDQETPIRRSLAHALLKAERLKEAAAEFEALLKVIPRQSAGDLMRGLGLAAEGLRDYERALAQWNALVSGLPRAAEPWFEARYHQVLCHAKAGRTDHARRLLEYFRVQVPQGAPGAWAGRFEALERDVGAAPATPAGP